MPSSFWLVLTMNLIEIFQNSLIQFRSWEYITLPVSCSCNDGSIPLLELIIFCSSLYWVENPFRIPFESVLDDLLHEVVPLFSLLFPEVLCLHIFEFIIFDYPSFAFYLRCQLVFAVCFYRGFVDELSSLDSFQELVSVLLVGHSSDVSRGNIWHIDTYTCMIWPQFWVRLYKLSGVYCFEVC